jgi:hypothetical protein
MSRAGGLRMMNLERGENETHHPAFPKLGLGTKDIITPEA